MTAHPLTLGDFFSLGQDDAELTILVDEVLGKGEELPAPQHLRAQARQALSRLGKHIRALRPAGERDSYTSLSDTQSEVLTDLPKWIGSHAYQDALDMLKPGGQECAEEWVRENSGPLSAVRHLQTQLAAFVEEHTQSARNAFALGRATKRLASDLAWCPEAELDAQSGTRKSLDLDEACRGQRTMPVGPCHPPEEHMEMIRAFATEHLDVELSPIPASRQQYRRKETRYLRRYDDLLKSVMRLWIKQLLRELSDRPIAQAGASVTHLEEIRMTPDKNVHAKLGGVSRVLFGAEDKSRAANIMRTLCAIEEDSIDSSKLKVQLRLEKPVRPGTLRQWARSIREALKKTFREDAALWTKVVSVRNVEEVHVVVSTPPFYDGEKCPRRGCRHRYTLLESTLRKCPECGYPHKEYQHSSKTRRLEHVPPLQTATNVIKKSSEQD